MHAHTQLLGYMFISETAKKKKNFNAHLTAVVCRVCFPSASACQLTISHSFIFQDKAENIVMAAVFQTAEDGNLSGLKELLNMANNVNVNIANRVSHFLVVFFHCIYPIYFRCFYLINT